MEIDAIDYMGVGKFCDFFT